MSVLHGIKKFLEHKAYQMRVDSLVMTSLAGSGHPTSALSAADLVAALFFYAMRFDPNNPNNPNNDRFILSKGHAAPIFYAAWKQLGILTDDDIAHYREFNSVLEGHPTLRFSRTEAATGSLGMGLSIGVGMALSAKMDHRDFYTYVLLGDSESTEGSIWEAVEIAAYYHLSNLVAILDCNRLGQSTETIHGYHLQRYADKFAAFGWKPIIIDGHDMQQIMSAFEKARTPNHHPTIIIAKTIKGYGVEKAENKEGFHGKAFKKEELNEILAQMEARFSSAAHYSNGYTWHPQIPQADVPESRNHCVGISFHEPQYAPTKEVATRLAYGQSLATAGSDCKFIISLDAEVKNSTMAELFEQKYPARFIQCFVAEQNMIGMAVGLERRGKIPFVSTFGAFFSRAYDQIRMAAIGTANLRLVGSHAGISIGQDGPSQMALEDLGLMQALANSVVLYPSDAVSTAKLVEQMIEYNQGISYLRTTRTATPILYQPYDDFPIGYCKIVKQSSNDVACIIGAGITLHEALKAYDLLAQEGISISVIDLYCIKPLPVDQIVQAAQNAQNKVLTVEDHYLQGGFGQAVSYALRNHNITIECLAVTELPRSGKPEELLAWAKIDTQAIINTVKKLR